MQEQFEKINALNQVAEFHQTFGAPVLATPQLIPEERAQLRISLLEEELNELKAAIADNNIVEIADALCDLQYVLSGAVLEFGLGNSFVELFNEVQRSNMSKACENESMAQQTQQKYAAEQIDTTLLERNGKYVILRAADNKVLKSIAYSPADLQKIIAKNEKI